MNGYVHQRWVLIRHTIYPIDSTRLPQTLSKCHFGVSNQILPAKVKVFKAWTTKAHTTSLENFLLWNDSIELTTAMIKCTESIEMKKSVSMRRSLWMLPIQRRKKMFRCFCSDECHCIQINTNLSDWIFDQNFSHVEVNTRMFDKFLVARHYLLDFSDFTDIMYDDKCVGNPHELPLYLVVYPIELNTKCLMFCCFGKKIWCSSWIRVSNFNKLAAKKDVWTLNTEHFSSTCQKKYDANTSDIRCRFT